MPSMGRFFNSGKPLSRDASAWMGALETKQMAMQGELGHWGIGGVGVCPGISPRSAVMEALAWMRGPGGIAILDSESWVSTCVRSVSAFWRLHEPMGLAVCRGELLIADYRTASLGNLGLWSLVHRLLAPQVLLTLAGTLAYAPGTLKQASSPRKLAPQWATPAGNLKLPSLEVCCERVLSSLHFILVWPTS